MDASVRAIEHAIAEKLKTIFIHVNIAVPHRTPLPIHLYELQCDEENMDIHKNRVVPLRGGLSMKSLDEWIRIDRSIKYMNMNFVQTMVWLCELDSVPCVLK